MCNKNKKTHYYISLKQYY